MTLQGWDSDSRTRLFAHVVSLSVNAVHEAWNRRPRAFAHADCLAQAVGLDMAALGWTPTAENFLGRVTKARILQAVAEAKGQDAADRIAHLKKGDMAAECRNATGQHRLAARTTAHADAGCLDGCFDLRRGCEHGVRQLHRRRYAC